MLAGIKSTFETLLLYEFVVSVVFSLPSTAVAVCWKIRHLEIDGGLAAINAVNLDAAGKKLRCDWHKVILA